MGGLDKESLIEKTMGAEVEYLTFPSHFDVAMRIRQALSRQDKPIEYVAEAIRRDPAITLKVVQEASRRNQGYGKVMGLSKAINMLGYEHIKRIALAMVCKQIDQSKATIRHTALSRLIWLNTMYTASAAHVIADNMSSFNPEEAFMCGMMVNVGAFYLLHQACITPSLRDDYDTMTHAIDRYYLARTVDILTIFEMSQDCISAVSIQNEPDEVWKTDFKVMRDVIYAANHIAAIKFPWVTEQAEGSLDGIYPALMPEVDSMFITLKNDKY